ncbi:MAG: type II secretion system protein [bacterium]|nr:type II secretion system protein [bacterium]
MTQLNKKGFTIVELMLAMGIVSALMIGIAVMVMQMSAIMTRGNTLKELNVAARTINSDFTERFNSVQTVYGWNGESVPSATSGASYIKNANGGAFCTGNFTYLWNSASNLNSNDPNPVRYDGDDNNSDAIRLIRIKDTSKKYCNTSNEWTKIPKGTSEVTEVLSTGETGLMIYDISFTLANANTVSGQSLINIQYTLGTRSDNGQVSNSQCNPGNSYQDYCAINKFNLTVRTIGRG